jgi:hypothetical protein
MRLVAFLLSLFLLTGCSTLFPKRVELFQEKVQKFPEATPAQQEVQRQAASMAEKKAQETVVEALKVNAPTNVVEPAKETLALTAAVADSLGPPARESHKEAEVLAAELRATIAKLNAKIDAFEKKNDENTGKKIEGTGLVSVPYFLWLGGIVGLVLIVWFVLKAFLTVAAAANPAASVGLGALNIASGLAAKGFSQVVKGGENFKGWVESEVKDSDLKTKILDAFVAAHKQAQDEDVKNVVKGVLK